MLSIGLLVSILSPLTSFAAPSDIGFSQGWKEEGERIERNRLMYIKAIQEFLNQSAAMGVPLTFEEAQGYADTITGGSFIYSNLLTKNMVEIQNRQAEMVNSRRTNQ